MDSATEKAILNQLERIDRDLKKSSSDRLWDMAGKILVPLVLALGAWMIGLEIRISAVEAREFPPKWLKDDVSEIKGALKDINGRLRDLERGK